MLPWRKSKEPASDLVRDPGKYLITTIRVIFTVHPIFAEIARIETAIGTETEIAAVIETEIVIETETAIEKRNVPKKDHPSGDQERKEIVHQILTFVLRMA